MAGARAARRRLLPAALCAAAVLATASSASAVIVQLDSGKTLSYQPLRGSQPFAADAVRRHENLIYHGGPVMPSNTNYAFYWAPAARRRYPAGYQPGVNRYLEDLAHDSGGDQNVDSVATQYNDASGQRRELRLALRRRDHRHRPVPDQRLQSRRRSA